VVAAILWREDVDRDERVVGEEARFEDRRAPSSISLRVSATRSAYRCGADRSHAAREAIARERTDLPALVEAVLEHLVGLQLDGQRLVDFPPEELVDWVPAV